MDKFFFRGLLTLSLLASACGGTTPEVDSDETIGDEDRPRTETGDPAAVSEDGEAITDATGRAISVRAHRAWEDGLAKFNEYHSAGWNRDRCREVDNLFERANSEHGGRFAEALFMRGLTKKECGTSADGRPFFDQALQVNANYCQARVATGMIALEGGDREGARRIFQMALDNDENCMSAYANIAMLLPENPTRDQLNESLYSLSSALAFDSDFLPVFNEMAILYYREGVRQHNSGYLDLAHTVCVQATMIEAQSGARYADIWNTWGLLRLHHGDINEALRFFRNALDRNDNIYEAHMNFANITFQFRGYEDAERSYRRASELQPRSYDAVVGLGAALRGLERYDDAQQMYERAIQIDAARPEAYFNLGQLYQSYRSGSVEDLQRARGYYEQFGQRAGANPVYAAAVTDLNRRCERRPARRGGPARTVAGCRPGYLQLIDDTITMMRQAEEMERQMREMNESSGEGGDGADGGGG